MLHDATPERAVYHHFDASRINLSLSPLDSYPVASSVSRSRSPQRIEIPQPAAYRNPAARSVSKSRSPQRLSPLYGVNGCVHRGIPISSGLGNFFVRP